MTISAVASYKTDVGQQRNHNEDYVWGNPETGLYIVADGVGGQRHGEVASRMAVDYARQLLESQLDDAVDAAMLLADSLEQVNQHIHATAQQHEAYRKMSTTLLVALFQADKLYIGHVGDTRAYLWRNASLQQLTEDDVWPLFSGRFAKKFENYLTKYIGQDHKVEPQIVEVALTTNDRLLLCTDGLWKMVSQDELTSYLQTADTPEMCVNRLISAANEAGGDDNISVVVINIR